MSRSQRVVKSPKEAPIKPAKGLFRTADGVELYFEDSGGKGTPLFFIYGLACAIQHWKYPRAYLAQHTDRRQIWMDFRGHGRSQAPQPGQRLSLALIADDIAALCAARHIEQAVILGQSMGGTVALALAARHPRLARAMVLLASPGRDPAVYVPGQPFSRLLWRGLTTLNRLVPDALRLAHRGIARSVDQRALRFLLIEAIRSGGFNRELAKVEDIDEYLTELLKVDFKLFLELAEDMSRFDVANFAKKLTCPVLLIAGAQDKIVPPPETHYIADVLPDAELLMLDHGSHCPHFDDPGTVSRLIEEFLVRHRI